MQWERSHIEDSMLFDRVQKGNRKAFDALFMKYYPVLCAYASQYVGVEEREEIVQDFMVWLWENRLRITLQSSFRNYLFVAIKNKCLTYLYKQEIRMRINNLIYDTNKELYDDPDFYVVEELSKNIETAIQNLPESYREAFVMNRFQQLSYQEIAKQLDVSPKTVDYRIQQALKQLRISLKDYLPFITFI